MLRARSVTTSCYARFRLRLPNRLGPTIRTTCQCPVCARSPTGYSTHPSSPATISFSCPAQRRRQALPFLDLTMPIQTIDAALAGALLRLAITPRSTPTTDATYREGIEAYLSVPALRETEIGRA